MKELIKRWLFKEEIERLARLETIYRDRETFWL
jgi:hypothetical protein